MFIEETNCYSFLLHVYNFIFSVKDLCELLHVLAFFIKTYSMFRFGWGSTMLDFILVIVHAMGFLRVGINLI